MVNFLIIVEIFYAINNYKMKNKINYYICDYCKNKFNISNFTVYILNKCSICFKKEIDKNNLLNYITNLYDKNIMLWRSEYDNYEKYKEVLSQLNYLTYSLKYSLDNFDLIKGHYYRMNKFGFWRLEYIKEV